MGRNAIGIEREPEYCDIIRKRMAAVQQPLPLTVVLGEVESIGHGMVSEERCRRGRHAN